MKILWTGLVPFVTFTHALCLDDDSPGEVIQNDIETFDDVQQQVDFHIEGIKTAVEESNDL